MNSKKTIISPSEALQWEIRTSRNPFFWINLPDKVTDMLASYYAWKTKIKYKRYHKSISDSLKSKSAIDNRLKKRFREKGAQAGKRRVL